MSSRVSYKRFATVNLLHGYYLDQDGLNFFDKTEVERENRLANVLVGGRYRIMEQLLVEPTENTKKLLAGHKIVFKQTPIGFLLGIAVEFINSDDGVRYKPLIPVDLNTTLQFKVKVKAASFRSVTNTRLNPVFPACYYFTNQSNDAVKVYPSLSVPATDFQNGYLYAMGETAMVDGVFSRAIKQTSLATDGWTPFSDRQYMGESDRLLLPKDFNYKINVPAIQEAEFQLRKNDDTVKAITIKNEAGLKEVLLNFEKKEDQSVIENGFYELVVNGSNGFHLQHQVYLDNDLYSQENFAVIDLALHTGDAAFSLLDNDGLLSNHYSPGIPRFEVRMLSRTTYWKYYFKKAQPVVVDPLWEDAGKVPANFAKVIVSRDPISLTQDFQKLNYGATILPNPAEANLSLEANKLCSDILIN